MISEPDTVRRAVRPTAMARRLLRDQSGATAVEYALVLAGIAAVIIAMVYAFGSKVNAEYNKPASGWP